MNKLIKAALTNYEAQRDEALAVLEVYLNNSVGIGEHSGLIDEVKTWTESGFENGCREGVNIEV